MNQQLTLHTRTVVELPRDRVFSLFGSEEAAGWLFAAKCDRVAVGATVRLSLPLRPHADFSVEILGRFSRIRLNSSITIEHHQPWRGRLRIDFASNASGTTRVRTTAELDPAGVDWLVRRVGLTLPDPAPTAALRIGIMTSKSGPAAIYAMGIENMAELAADHINASGGIGGTPVEIIVTDDATDPHQAAREAGRMARAGCRAIFACTTSASFFAATAAVGNRDVLVVQPVINEGGSESGTVVRLAERPASQIAALADPIMEVAGGRTWFLVGQQYSWSFGAHAAARSVLSGHEARIVGEHLTPLGTTDFSKVVETIVASKAEVVLSSLIGSDEVAFQTECAAAGLDSSVQILSLVMDESTYEHIGGAKSDNIWTALGYFETSGVSGNSDLVSEYRAKYGPWAPPVTSLSETVYEAMMQYARIVTMDPLGSVRDHATALRSKRGGSDASTVGRRDLTSRRLFLARADRGTLRIFDETD